MKRVFSYLITSLFVLGFALGAVGCSGDLTDYGKDGGAMQSYQWYQEKPRNKAAPTIITDTNDHYWLIGECSASAPEDSWAFNKADDGPNAGKWVLTFRPKQLASWGADNDDRSELVFCVAGPLPKSKLSWPTINAGYRYSIDENSQVSIGLNEVTKLSQTANADPKNFKVTGLTLQKKDVEEDSDEYTCVFDDSSGSPMFVMVPGGAGDKISTDPPIPTYLTANFEGKPYSAELVRGETAIKVTATGASTTLYLTWKDKNYKGTITLGTEATLSEDTTQVGSSLTGLEAGELYKIAFNAKDESALKVTVKHLASMALKDEISYVCSNYGNKPINWVSMEPTDDGEMYGSVVFSASDSEAGWSKSTIEFGVTKGDGDWSTKYVDGTLTLNGGWTALTKNGSNNNTVTATPGDGLKQDYILAIKSTKTQIFAQITPVWNFMICPDCVTEIAGEGVGGLGNNQWYPPKIDADGVFSYKFKVKALNPISWSFNDGIPFAFVANKSALKADGSIDQDWSENHAFKGANIDVGTEDTATALKNNAGENAGTKNVVVGDTITIHVKTTKTGSDVTAAKAWITKE